MVAFSTIKAGDTLWEKRRQKMGNTMMSQDVIFPVTIIEVHEGYAMARWNGNPPTRWGEYQIAKLTRKKPERKPSIFDRAVMARAAAKG